MNSLTVSTVLDCLGRRSLLSTAQIRMNREILRNPHHSTGRFTLGLGTRCGASLPPRAPLRVRLAAIMKPGWYPGPAVVRLAPRSRWTGVQFAGVGAYANVWDFSIAAPSTHKPLQRRKPERLRRWQRFRASGAKIVHRDRLHRNVHGGTDQTRWADSPVCLAGLCMNDKRVDEHTKP